MTQPLWAPWRLQYIQQADELPGCVFCDEAAGRLDPSESLIIHGGTTAIALLNKYPYASGHLMVAPRRHVGELTELTDGEALEIHALAASSVATLRAVYGPDAFNLGWNLGRAAGAGIADHVHQHVVPRWGGDTNFMPVIGDVRVLPQSLSDSWKELRRVF